MIRFGYFTSTNITFIQQNKGKILIDAIKLFFFSFYSPAGGAYDLIKLFVQYYSVICCPSDHTVRRLGPRFEPGKGGLVAGILTTRPPHLTHGQNRN